jgi:hypothetical protein
MAAATAVIMFVMPPNVSHADPPHQFAQIRAGLGPQHQVPMIGHQAIRQQLNGVSRKPFTQHTLKSKKVFILVKQLHPSIAAIQNMINHTSFNGASGAWHGNKLPPRRFGVNNQ